MASSTFIMIACIVVLAMVLATPVAEAALLCGTVLNSLAGCTNYVKSNGAMQVPARCCRGIRTLNGLAKSSQDRKAVCNCLKTVSIRRLNLGLVAGLPGKCGVNIPYKISPSTDCNKVH